MRTAGNLEAAIAIAAFEHAGQTDKGGQPYILHPIRVMLAMSTDEDRIVAVLHDIVEDTEVTLAKIGDEFGGNVAGAVDALTKRHGESYSAYLARVGANPIARRVKMADLADNCNLKRLGREPTAEDAKRLARYQDATGYLFRLPSPPKTSL